MDVEVGGFLSRLPETVFEPRPPHVDVRGTILNLVDAAFGSAAVISSVKGSIRGNHYHRTDYHYCWLQSGSLDYYHRKVRDTAPPSRWTVKAGDVFYTPPMYEHAMRFTEDSVFFVFARNNREMENYEADTVRVTLIE